MLQVFKNDWIPINNAYSYYIDYIFGGDEELNFTLSANDDIYLLLREEVLIREDYEHPNLYVIKKINRIDDEVMFTAELCMDDWKTNKPYTETKNNPAFQTKTLAQLLEYIKPTGWTILNANIISIKRTPELDGVNSYDVLIELKDIFKVVYEIDALNKKITVLDPNQVVDKGLYLHNELNLTEVVEKGDSSNFINRLYAYGKDALSFSSINGGKDYVEDLSYKENIVTGYWKDERYTVKESLLEDANKKLKEAAYPVKSYTANIIDLAKVNPKYAFLDIKLYDLVHVFIGNELEVLEKVVKYREYKLDNERHLNIITLSTQPQQLTNKVDKISSILGDDGQKFQGSILQQAQQEATQLINNFATKGHIYLTENELYILDQLPKESAKYVLRINLGGIAFSQNGWAGPYISAWTIDGKFNADFITAGTLRAINVEGVSIKGGSITGETTINVGTDLTVGDNIYIGQNQSTDKMIEKKIQFTTKDYIAFSKWSQTSNFNAIDLQTQRYFTARVGDKTTEDNADITIYNKGISINKMQKDKNGNIINNLNSVSVGNNNVSIQSLEGLVGIVAERVMISAFDSIGLYAPVNQYNVLKMLGGQQEFYTTDGNYVGKIQAMSHNGVGSVGIGVMADSGDNIFMGAGNTWYFVVSGGGSYSQPLNAYGNLDMHGWNIVNSSDKRLKENVQNIDTGFIYDLEIKVFDYIEGNKDIVGIMANDYVDKEYSKYFILQGTDGLYSVNYQNINNALIQCVQEQKKEINNLEKRLEALENLIKGLIK